MKKNILFLLITLILIGIFLSRGFFVELFSQNSSDKIKIGNNTIKIQNIKINQKISSPLLIKGFALNTWFLEATFPVKIITKDGTLLTSGIAKADSNWKSNGFIPFHSKLIFNAIGYKSGEIIFENGNSFDFSKENKEFKLPITF